MQGKHHIIVQSAHLKYELDVKRNITKPPQHTMSYTIFMGQILIWK